jgi:hypothetical protein
MGTFGIRSKKRQSQINDGAISQIMKMYDNSKLRAKERQFEPKDLATKFAMWFVVNWEWHDDTEKGAKYLSIYDGKTVKTIGEIYDRWLLNDI